jgi:hypothetical protein
MFAGRQNALGGKKRFDFKVESTPLAVREAQQR